MSPPAIPWSIWPAPTQSLVDCGVGEVCDQAEPLKLVAFLLNVTSILPSKLRKSRISPYRKCLRQQSPGRFGPPQCSHLLIVVWVRCVTRRSH